jgi:predicted cobalt transporter CbtA
VGAPHPEMHGFAHPDPQALTSLEALQAQFVYATAIANAVFWVVLGALAGYASRWVAKD